MIDETFDVLQQSPIKSRMEQIKKAKDEASQLLLVRELFRQIQMASQSIVGKIGSGVSVTNLDEISTALHNESKKNTNALLAALKEMKFSQEKQAKVLVDITKEGRGMLDEEYMTFRIPKPSSREETRITNLHEIPLAEEVDVKNMPDFEQLFRSLELAVREALNINLPAPQVRVEAPVVNLPQQAINIPESDFEPLLHELKRGLNKLRTNNVSNPMFVRLTELERIISVLEEVREASRNVMLGFPGSISLRAIGGGIADPTTFGSGNSLIASTLGDGSKAVTTAGTRVQLVAVSTPCKWVVVTAKVGNVGTIYIGGNTIATARGKPLTNLQETEIKINDVSQVYMDADTNGDGATFYYGS